MWFRKKETIGFALDLDRLRGNNTFRPDSKRWSMSIKGTWWKGNKPATFFSLLYVIWISVLAPLWLRDGEATAYVWDRPYLSSFRILFAPPSSLPVSSSIPICSQSRHPAAAASIYSSYRCLISRFSPASGNHSRWKGYDPHNVMKYLCFPPPSHAEPYTAGRPLNVRLTSSPNGHFSFYRTILFIYPYFSRIWVQWGFFSPHLVSGTTSTHCKVGQSSKGRLEH